MSKQLAYSNRSYAAVRADLINLVRQYYPDVLTDLNDSSVGSMLIDLNAAVGDMLSYNTDMAFQETQIDYAQRKNSVLSMARTFGLKIPGYRPSISMVDFSVTLPVDGDSFDLEYAPLIRLGCQVSGSGKVFETVNDIDFANPFNSEGIPNRTIIPNKDSNGRILNYTIAKREIVINGTTKIYSKTINTGDVVPFYNITLPDDNVLSVTSIIAKQGVNYTTQPSIDDFLNPDLRYYEVDALADDTMFVEDYDLSTDNSGISPGKWIRITKKFIREYTDKGFMKVIFGGGVNNIDNIDGLSDSLGKRIGDFINNLSLGETLTPNTTLYIQYRVGGGSASNLGPNTITSVTNKEMSVNGPDTTVNNSIIQSLSVNNPIPAIGGANEPSIDEIRNMVRYNFSSQNRAVTLKDYLSIIKKMPGEFGVPFRVGTAENQNKIEISILGLDNGGKLTNESTNTLKNNISNYLADYRMVNDYVVIKNGKILNLEFQIDVLVTKEYPQSQVMSSVINAVRSYMNINKWEMGENIYIGPLVETVNNLGGVVNVIDIRIYNKVGNGLYSVNETNQKYSDSTTKQIDISDNYTLYGEPDTMYEIKYPSTDIKVRVK